MPLFELPLPTDDFDEPIFPPVEIAPPGTQPGQHNVPVAPTLPPGATIGTNPAALANEVFQRATAAPQAPSRAPSGPSGRSGGRSGRTGQSGGSGGHSGGGQGPPFGGVGNTFDDPATSFLEDFINFRLGELFPPVNDPFRQSLFEDLQTRIGQLREQPFTTSEENILRTRSIDDIERQRTAAQANTLERMAARGFAPTSGLVEQGARDVDQQFNALRAQESGDFGRLAIQERQNRLNQALTLADALAQGEFAQRQENEQRRGQMLALSQLAAELPERRLQLALATLGLAPPPGSLFNSIANFVNLAQQQQQLGLQSQAIQNANTQSAFGGFANMFSNLLRNSGGGQTNVVRNPFTNIPPNLFGSGLFGQDEDRIGIGSFLG